MLFFFCKMFSICTLKSFGGKSAKREKKEALLLEIVDKGLVKRSILKSKCHCFCLSMLFRILPLSEGNPSSKTVLRDKHN